MAVIVHDAFGEPFELAEPARRIISLIPSITETLFSLEAGDRLVGVSTFRAEPPDGVTTKTKLGGHRWSAIAPATLARGCFFSA